MENNNHLFHDRSPSSNLHRSIYRDDTKQTADQRQVKWWQLFIVALLIRVLVLVLVIIVAAALQVSLIVSRRNRGSQKSVLLCPLSTHHEDSMNEPINQAI